MAAEADPAAAQADYEAAMRRNDMTKLPIWYGQADKDVFKPEDWWNRFETAAGAAHWDWPQVRCYFMQALRGDALEWYNTVTKQCVINDIDDLKNLFMIDYAKTRLARSSITDLRINQTKGQSVRTYMSKIQTAFNRLELVTVPVTRKATRLQCLPNPPQGVNLADLPLDWLIQCVYDHQVEAYQGFYTPTLRNIFIQGLLPHIQDEVVRLDRPGLRDCYEDACKAEMDFERKASPVISSVDTDAGDIHAVHRYHQQYTPSLRGGPSNRGRGRGRGTSRSTVPRDAVCHYCKKLGHYQKECRTRLRENGAMKPPPRKSVQEIEEEDDPNPINLNSLEQYLNW
jgi:hypothetical protein